LSGYEDARPMRVGNAAATQRQHDVWGSVLDSVYLHTKSRDYLPERVWPMLKRAVECAIANWSKPDQGIWEVRGDAAAFRLLQADVLGGLRPGGPAGQAARRPRPGHHLAQGRRGDPCRH